MNYSVKREYVEYKNELKHSKSVPVKTHSALRKNFSFGSNSTPIKELQNIERNPFKDEIDSKTEEIKGESSDLLECNRKHIIINNDS